MERNFAATINVAEAVVFAEHESTQNFVRNIVE